jgi:hypothetical protein
MASPFFVYAFPQAIDKFYANRLSATTPPGMDPGSFSDLYHGENKTVLQSNMDSPTPAIYAGQHETEGARGVKKEKSKSGLGRFTRRFH